MRSFLKVEFAASLNRRISMDAEHINTLQAKLHDLDARSQELRRYL
jgi:hypothetical protein